MKNQDEAWGGEIPPYHKQSPAQYSEGFGHTGGERNNSWRGAWEMERLAPPTRMLLGKMSKSRSLPCCLRHTGPTLQAPTADTKKSSAIDLFNGTRLVHIAQNHIHWHGVLKQISLEV